MAFLDDIKSKHLTNYVLVTIGDNIRISTQNINFDGEYYKPILMNIPSISESLDIERRKYKISSVTLNISDYEHDGVRFSDSLNTLMNKEVNIYYASMGSKEFTFFGDSQGTTKEDADLYKAGTFIVRSFNQNEDTVSLNCEDLSQKNLQTEIPLVEMSDNESILEKYRNKPIPMVFGEVDRSPCVLDSKKIIFDVGDATDLSGITVDDIFFKIKTPLYIYDDDSTYSNVLHDISEILTEEEFPYIQEQQYIDVSNLGYLELKNTKLLRKDGIQVRRFAKSASPNLYNDNQVENIVDATDIIDRDGNPQDTIDNDNSSYVLVQDAQFTTSDEAGGIDGDFNPITLSFFRYYRMIIPIVKAKDTIANGIPEIAINNKRFPIPFNGLSDEGSNFINNADNENYIIAGGSNAGSLNNVSFFPNNLESHPSSLQNYSDLIIFNETEVGTELGQGEASLDQFNVDIGFKDTSFQASSAAIGCFANEQIFELVFFAKLPQTALLPSGETYTSELVARIREIDTTFIADIGEPLKKHYFVHAIGRGSSTPSAPSVFTEILSELNFNQVVGGIDYTSLGSYSFTIDKKINSKKLIEEISQSTSLYPYFKDGQFKLKSINKSYSFNETKSINPDDVINYKYDRTKIEKVYTRVNVKYHYDYGIKDFTRETGDVTPTNSGLDSDYLTGSNENYFGEDFDQELIFESKYIRDEATAFNLARYLCGLHANQHNLITLTLPLNYITLELGDIVRLDKLIQGRKIFGEDYALIHENQPSYIRNGQTIYKFFFVEQIKKSLDKVEVKLYQLHEFDFTPDDVGVDEIEDEIDDEIEDIIDDTEPPVDPPPSVIEACLLPDFENSYLDGNLNPVDVTDNSLIFSHNQDLCGNEIVEEQVGWCTINGIPEFGVTESDCTGTWTVNQPVIACGDPNALNYNSNVDIADNTLCFLQEPLLSPQITTPTEDEVIPLQSIEEVNQPEFNDSDWVWNNNSQNVGNFIIEGGNQSIIIRQPQFDFSKFIKIYPRDLDGNLIPIEYGSYDYTVIARRVNNNNFSIGLKIGFNYNTGNTHNLSTDFNEFSGSFNASNNVDINNGFFVIKQGAGNSNNNDNSFEISTIEIRRNGINLIPDPNRNSYFSNNTAGGMITVETSPVLNLTWNKSPNLLNHSQLPPNYLGGSYIVSLVRSYNDENGDTQLENVYTNENNLISAVEGQDTYTHTIDFVEQDIPVNSRLQVSVIARSFSQYNGQNIFTGDADAILDYTIAQDTVNFNYGNVDEEEQAYNVSDIVILVNFILGESSPTQQDLELYDINNDGIINILDILNLVNIILGN